MVVGAMLNAHDGAPVGGQMWVTWKHGSYLGGEADFLRGSRHVTHLPVERSDRVELSEVWYFLSIVQVRHFMSNMWGAI